MSAAIGLRDHVRLAIGAALHPPKTQRTDTRTPGSAQPRPRCAQPGPRCAQPGPRCAQPGPRSVTLKAQAPDLGAERSLTLQGHGSWKPRRTPRCKVTDLGGHGEPRRTRRTPRRAAGPGRTRRTPRRAAGPGRTRRTPRRAAGPGRTRNGPAGRGPRSSRAARPGQVCVGKPRFTPPCDGSSHRLVITLPRVKKCTPSAPCACVSPNSDDFQPPNE
jgi:hypothetical protein